MTRWNFKALTLSALGLSPAVVLTCMSISHASPLAPPAPFTDVQATDGKVIFDRACASCHGADLLGGADSPPLSGKGFVSFWGGKTVGDLVDKARTMPLGSPNSLSEQDYASLTAFMLKANGFPAGTDLLRPSSKVSMAALIGAPGGARSPIVATGAPKAAEAAQEGDDSGGRRPAPTREISPADAALLARLSPVDAVKLAAPPAADWLMWRGAYNGWGYSPLDKINKQTVSHLQLAWSWGMNAGRVETTPLVHDGIMFLQHACNYVQALNAKNGDLLWEYRRPVVKHENFLACNNRSPALYDDKLILGTYDASLVALDVHTGKVIWDQKVGDYAVGHGYSGGPIMAGDKVIAGMTGCFYYNPGGCWISAHDVKTGKELWRTKTIAGPGDPNDKTWNGVPMDQRFGGSSWSSGTFDPQTNTLYIGTAVPIPWGSVQRGTGDGATLYTDSTLALDAATGKIKWYFQHLPNDEWDLDHPFVRLIVDTEVAPDPSQVKWISPHIKRGETRRVLTGIPGKTGVVWTLDAETGAFLWARPTTEQNVMLGVNTENGSAIINPAIRPSIGKSVYVCPSPMGGANWQAPAYSPRTNTFYAPLNNTCMDYTLNEVEPKLGAYHGSARSEMSISPSAKGNAGSLVAIDVKTGKTKWQFDQRAGFPASVLATGGGLVFVADDNRRLRAFDEDNGKVLWEQILGSRPGGFPITYEVDGEQYLAIPGGNGLIGIARLTPENFVPDSPMLYVFKLPK